MLEVDRDDEVDSDASTQSLSDNDLADNIEIVSNTTDIQSPLSPPRMLLSDLAIGNGADNPMASKHFIDADTPILNDTDVKQTLFFDAETPVQLFLVPGKFKFSEETFKSTVVRILVYESIFNTPLSLVAQYISV